MSIRKEIDPVKLEYLDHIAAIVAKLYDPGDPLEKLGDKPDELRRAVYTLGQAYMLLYKELLTRAEGDQPEDVAG